MQYNGRVYRHDWNRLMLLENTLAAPVDHVASASHACPVVPRSFLNEHTCVQRPECAPFEYSSTVFTLDETALLAFYSSSLKYVYYLDGLRLYPDQSPCDRQTRWKRRSGACSDSFALRASARTKLADAIRSSTDSNPHLRDLDLSSMVCSFDYPSETLSGVRIDVDGVCWEHR